jgi:hypothetical protein
MKLILTVLILGLTLVGCSTPPPAPKLVEAPVSKYKLAKYDIDSTTFYTKYWAEQKEKIEAEARAKIARCKDKSKDEKPVSNKVRLEVEERYKEVLKDPYSAHFRKIREASEWDRCMEFSARYRGEVNAKNSYGGYIGYKDFSAN